MNMPKLEKHSVLFDTSFFLRLLNKDDNLHNNAMGYFRYFSYNKYIMKISTIAIAEFCVKGEATELPLRNLQVLPFNFDHAARAGLFARLVFENKKRKGVRIAHRPIVPNDSKMFAQADIESDIDYFVSSDTEALKVINLLRDKANVNFRYLDIHTPYNQIFGELDFKQ